MYLGHHTCPIMTGIPLRRDKDRNRRTDKGKTWCKGKLLASPDAFDFVCTHPMPIAL